MPVGKKVYDFAPMSLWPLRKGPRIAERPRTGLGRTTRELRAVFARNHADIASCWKYQTSRGAKTTLLTAGMTIEPLGSTRDLTVTGERSEDQALAACVTTALSTSSFIETTTRPIRLTARLAFTRSQQPEWKRAWPTPVAHPDRDLRTGTVCSHVIDDGQVAQVELPKPLEVTDWDDSREPPSRGAVPEVRVGCAQTFVDTDKRAIRMGVKSNYGALQRCYADAAARDPRLAGEVTLQLTFDRAGATNTARVTGGVGDPALHACLVAGLEDVWVSPGPHAALALEANLTFTLAPLPSPPPAADDPVALLAGGDAEGALAAWTAKLRTPVSPELACRGRAGVVLAIAELAPWLDDARFHAALADLARAAAVLSPERARTCVGPVNETINELTHARGQPYGGHPMTHVWLDRYTAALPLAPYLDDGAVLRWYHATALLNTSRRAEAMALLEQLAWDPKIGAAVTKELEQRKRTATEPISDTCSN